MKTKLDHVNFTVTDLEQSTMYYQNLFDFQVVEKGSNHWGAFAIMKNGDTMLALREKSGPKGADLQEDFEFHRVQHFALNVDDKREWEKRLTQHKPALSMPDPVDYPYSTSWYVLDPNGHEIEVVYWNQQKPQFP